MKTITLESINELKKEFETYTKTAEQNEFPLLFMIESHESVVRRCADELDSANKDCQQAIFSRASSKRKTELFNYASRCLVQYLEAFDKLTAIKLFYRLEEKKQ